MPTPPTDLHTFPRPSVAVDIAVCSVVPDIDGEMHLAVLVHRRETRTETGRWSLPGSFVREYERLADAVDRTLRDKAGVEGLHPRQLLVLDDPKRDPRGWVLSVAHVDTVPMSDAIALIGGTDVAWAPVVVGDAPAGALDLPGRHRSLPFDHEVIVTEAVADLRRRYAERPDPAGLLAEPFTVLELRRVHEAVAGERLQKDTFRRAMLPGLRETSGPVSGSVGRPARRYRRA